MRDRAGLMPWSTADKRNALQLFRIATDEFWRAAGASARCGALRSQGVNRASIGRRIFEEYYSETNSINHRRRRT
jgi:hypothetical protein